MSNSRNVDHGTMLSLAECVTLACLFEVSAAKVGNVHRGADFEDLTFADFATSAAIVGQVLETASDSVGAAVLAAVQRTRNLVNTNTNLGTLLLLAPLCAVARGVGLRNGVQEVLGDLGADDARDAYRAICEAHAGGLGREDEMDIHGAPPESLLDAMRAASERDLVARQYANGFQEVFDVVVPNLVEYSGRGLPLTQSIVATQIRFLAEYPDSLIARKCGMSTARQASDRASDVLAAGRPFDEPYVAALSDFDFWLRSDAHRRNPGTTADLIAAGLFVVFRDELVSSPWR